MKKFVKFMQFVILCFDFGCALAGLFFGSQLAIAALLWGTFIIGGIGLFCMVVVGFLQSHK